MLYVTLKGEYMSWKCYSCGTINSNEDAACKKCGNMMAAPSNFYAHWIFGAAIVFMISYMTGTMAGGVLIESIAAPSDSKILKIANEQKADKSDPFKNLMQLKPAQLTAAKAVAIEQEKAKMSPVVAGLLKWIFPVLLFILSGIIVGFVSAGKTIIEPGIGSVLGQAAGAAIMIYLFKTEAINWTTVAIGILPGAGFGILGAWLGELIQDKKEIVVK
jgi:hypothetical protein